MQAAWATDFGIAVVICDDDRALCSQAEFSAWAAGRKQLRMEFFYREMRRKFNLLMDGTQPAGGRWNFDTDNRKAARADLFLPHPKRSEPDAQTRGGLDLVGARFKDHFGDLEPFWFAVTRAQAEAAADHFLEAALPGFGDHQDAMLRSEKFRFHSLLSPLINVGLIDPLWLCRRTEEEYRAGRVPLNSAEGFIRQIIGWREYVRGLYWLKGSDYLMNNALGADRRLPAMYWTGETDMACMAATIGQTREEAYAHHIQRLTVTGNFALLTGIDPHELHAWYLAVYADALNGSKRRTRSA